MNPNEKDSLRLRQATPSDVDWLIELRQETMSRHIKSSGQQATDDEHRKRVLFAFEHTRIVMLMGRAIGMVKVVRKPHEWEVVQIQLCPEFQGRGIGTDLLQMLMHEARRRSLPVSLSVLKGNPAKQLYERLGFCVVSEDEVSFKMKANA